MLITAVGSTRSISFTGDANLTAEEAVVLSDELIKYAHHVMYGDEKLNLVYYAPPPRGANP